MKNVIIAATVTLGLSASAQATSCDTIAKSIVDQYVSAANFATETPEQKGAYAGLVEAHKMTCQAGVAVRNKGMTPEDVAKVVQTTSRAAGDEKTINHVISRSMSITSYTQGYAFGE